MKNNLNEERKISRRGILPILGGSLLLPFLGFGDTVVEEVSNPEDEEYQTLLKPDGTTVKVKVKTIKKSKVVKKNVSNKSFLNWLGKKR
ncbi:MAG TPA: hypothetical protein VJ945_05820 [Flavobacteriaceae bacterium]|nr:hypothetical protein [Flavobacteriaceae bacterium]